MNRRKFLKLTGFTAASFTVSKNLFAQQEPSDKSKEKLLDGIDDRINKYRKAECTLTFLGPDGKVLKNSITVKIEQTRHKFLFGCNIFMLGRCRTPKGNEAYEKYFSDLLNFATLPFYWWAFEREKGKPDIARTEEIIKWCRAKNVVAKGHPLAWNWVDPRWLPDDPDKAMEVQFERISDCVSRFKGQIDIWDVVNEATDYTRDKQKEAAPKLTNGILKIGLEQYLRRAFKSARDANPDAKLIINDYRTDEAFGNNVLSVLVDDKKNPLYDVIGIQSHMHAGFWGIEKIWEVCNRFAKFNKPLHFTETTLLSGQQGWDLRAKSNDPNFAWSTTAEGEKRQAEQTGLFYSMLFSHPSVEALTWWDFSDQGAWMSAPAGLLRADMSPKPVYEKLHSLIKDKWWTRTEITANDSNAKFSGFLGNYKAAAEINGRSLTGSFSLDKDSKNITINLS